MNTLLQKQEDKCFMEKLYFFLNSRSFNIFFNLFIYDMTSIVQKSDCS